jgi:hypothetical protein
MNEVVVFCALAHVPFYAKPQVRGQWVPDAIAQLKFSPKHKARDVSQMLNVREAQFHVSLYHTYTFS